MSSPYLSEIRIFSFNFAPSGWVMCNGQLLSISANQALFALVGTTYGGNGMTTFGVPNLQGRIPLHQGGGFTVGQTGGQETVTLTTSQMPAHVHQVQADAAIGDATSFNASGSYLANTAPAPLYSSGSSNMVAMAPEMVSSVGSGQAHENRQPFLTLNYCMAVQGIFPSRN